MYLNLRIGDCLERVLFVDDPPNGVNFVNTSTSFRHFFGSKLFVLSLSRGQVNRAPLMWEKFQLLIQVSSAPKVPVRVLVRTPIRHTWREILVNWKVYVSILKA